MSSLTLVEAMDALEAVAPLANAAPWDNVGLLLEPSAEASAGRILLCIDLTEAVLTGSGGIVEVQGTAEERPFTESQFLELLGLAKKGIGELVAFQKGALGIE